ncbi:MAG: hypothetical protein E7Z90_01790 [Cyanobacteria bacterium SIG29]|nr:hypothetical protein [Cyanobacteria bacterium SIG29]
MNTVVGNPYVNIGNKNYKKDACKGAIIAAGTLTGTAAISWATDTFFMKNVVKKQGGKLKYMQKFALGLVGFSALGAMLNPCLNFISDNSRPSKPPKAV